MIEEISDARMEGKVRHPLSTIIFVALCGILCGCENWDDIRDYCAVKKDWLSQYINLTNGIPSSDTFRRVFTLLNPDSVEYIVRTKDTTPKKSLRQKLKHPAWDDNYLLSMLS